MQTFKTAVVVVLLLAVCYGAFKALNAPDPELPASIKEWITDGEGESIEFAELEIDTGEIASLDDAVPISPEELMSSFENAGVPESTNASSTASNAAGESFEGFDLSNVPSLDPTVESPGSSAGETPEFPSIPDLPNTPESKPNSTNSLPQPSDNAGAPVGADSNIATFPGSGQVSLPGATDLAAAGSLPNLPDLAKQAGEATSDLQQEFDKMVQNASESANQATGAAQNSVNQVKQMAESGAIDARKAIQDYAAGSELPKLPDLNTMGNQAVGNLTSSVSSRINAMTAESSRSLPGEASQSPTTKFSVAREQALALANRGELKNALEMLSPYYGSPELDYAQTQDLLEILDALAREVIYSKRHLMEPPHAVKATDSVQTVAKQYRMNPELLRDLNGLGETANAVVPGKELKVIRGPFHARIDLSAKELTIFVDNMYAGRFPFSAGSDPSPKAGSFEVVDRSRQRSYYGTGAVVLDKDDPRNPYGGYWINLGNDLCIHGSAQMPSPDLKGAGCISLAPRDAKHLYSILSNGSQVKISE
ncbi:MAG: L,D-transpeptidase family protein [Planctomycetota bacterium]